jgi:hypothetical protein
MIRTISTRTVQLAKQAPKYQQMAIRFGSNESYTEKQAKKGRPLSPHVTIYKFPTVALSSITNRVTGVILTGGILLFTCLSALLNIYRYHWNWCFGFNWL